MSMNKEAVAKVARLARLETTDEQNEKLAAELESILGWIEQLNAVDTDGVEPMTSAIPHKAYRRPDVVTDGEIADKVLSNAPEAVEGFFVVPKVVE